MAKRLDWSRVSRRQPLDKDGDDVKRHSQYRHERYADKILAVHAKPMAKRQPLAQTSTPVTLQDIEQAEATWLKPRTKEHE